MISRDTYARLKSKIDSWEQARRAADPKKFMRGGAYSRAENDAISATAGVSEPTNEERGSIELYEFANSTPDKYFAYYSNDMRRITTWMGDTIGEVISHGNTFKSSFGDRRVNIRMRAINGKTYSGTCFLDSGTYCRLKLVKGR